MADEEQEANGRGRSLMKITHARTRPHTVGVSVTEFSCMRGRSSGKTGPPFSTGQARRRAGGLKIRNIMGCADLGRPLCYLRWLIRARDRARAWRDVDMTEEEKRGPFTGRGL